MLLLKSLLDKSLAFDDIKNTLQIKINMATFRTTII